MINPSLYFVIGDKVKQMTYEELQSKYKLTQNDGDGKVFLCETIDESKVKTKPLYPEKPVFLYDVMRAELILYRGDNIKEQRDWVDKKAKVDEWMDFIRSQPSRWMLI